MRELRYFLDEGSILSGSVVNPERLNFLIYSKDLSRKLDDLLLSVKDIFVFGCAVGLRYSDLMALKKTNLETINKRVYLKVISQKTQTFSHVKLPPFAIDIIKKYNTSTNDFILPSISTSRFNDQLKLLMAKAGFTELITKTRNRRGIPVTINHSTKSKMQFRFCDLVTSHTMRRSAITTMLSLGMRRNRDSNPCSLFNSFLKPFIHPNIIIPSSFSE